MKKEKAPYRFGWVDWLILLLVVGAVFAGIYYWRSKRSREEDVRFVTYTLCILIEEGAEWESAIHTNSVVMNQNGTMDLGRVVSVQERHALQATVADGEVHFVPTSGQIELLVSVQAYAVWQAGDGFRVRDIRIAVGKTGDFRIGVLFAANATVISVK